MVSIIFMYNLMIAIGFSGSLNDAMCICGPNCFIACYVCVRKVFYAYLVCKQLISALSWVNRCFLGDPLMFRGTPFLHQMQTFLKISQGAVLTFVRSSNQTQCFV